MLKILLLLTISIITLYGGDSWAEGTTPLEWTVVSLLLLLLPLFFLFFIISIFDERFRNFTKKLFYILLSIFIFMFIHSYFYENTNSRFTYRANHLFQPPDEYGVYGEDRVIFKEQEHDIHTINVSKGLEYITQDGFIKCGVTLIDMLDYTPHYASCIENHNITNKISEILIFDTNQEADIKFLRNKKSQDEEDNESYPLKSWSDLDNNSRLNIFKFPNINYIDITKFYKKNSQKRDIHYIDDKFCIRNIFMKDKNFLTSIRYADLPTIILEVNSTQVRIYKNYEFFKPFNLKHIPQSAVYLQDKDKLLVVYKNEPRKIYLLNNQQSYVYEKIQNMVKSFIHDSLEAPFAGDEERKQIFNRYFTVKEIRETNQRLWFH